MIVSLALLFLWSNATMFLHKSPPKIPEVHIPEEPLLQFASGLRIEINRGFSALHDICIWEGSQEVPFCKLKRSLPSYPLSLIITPLFDQIRLSSDCGFY
ncbi:hypothetical protein Bca4012_026852 [Brassica carinata]